MHKPPLSSKQFIRTRFYDAKTYSKKVKNSKIDKNRNLIYCSCVETNRDMVLKFHKIQEKKSRTQNKKKSF